RSLVITTASPLPAATAAAAYSQTFAASGGSGIGYSWSATGLPAWLGLSAAGVLAGTPPVTAVDAAFSVAVTDSTNNSTPGSFSLPVTLAITTASPLPTGQVGVNYSQTLTAIGGTGVYTWALSAGSSLPGGLSLNSATGLISGPPSTAATSNFTIQATDSNRATATQAFAVTINPAAAIQTLSPNTSNAGLSLQVSITGSFTHFVQGTTVANFGPGIAVGGAAEGQPGPITVNSSTSATASIAIDPAAATGSQTVTVTTSAEQAAVANGFTIAAAVTVINVETSTSTPIAPGFSGFDDEHQITAVEYYDPKFVAAVQALKPGWIRFPSGTESMTFDWQAGNESQAWITELSSGTPPKVPTYTTQAQQLAQKLTQAQGGIKFQDYTTFLQAVGASGIVVFNSFTDTNPGSASNMVLAAQTAGVTIKEWELGNEAYFFPGIYATPAAYAAGSYSPYYTEMIAANPAAEIGVFFRGQFSGIAGNYAAWDNGMAAYTPKYWGAVSDHYYPIINTSLTNTQEEETLNGLLVYGTSEYVNSYLLPLIGANTPLFITEFNQGSGTIPFQAYLYNGVFLAEFTARMSTVPNVQGVGATALYLGNSYNEGMIRAVDDFQTYLLEQLAANPNYSTDTATNPNTQFSFYYSAPGLAIEVLNLAVNNSTGIWPTTVTGSPTVPILGYDGNPVPAVFAQGYVGENGVHYLVVTNKSGSAVPVGLEVNGSLLESTVTVSYVSNSDPTAQNTATDQNNVQIVNNTSPNPITVGPYSVTRIQW
ncbi:MAG TPA: putative Ig domain-containing protein, partial [Bryobacteraceae bacterium]|nr:putative Ig domain-containing protein [Bryobacteraceae bacterium]